MPDKSMKERFRAVAAASRRPGRARFALLAPALVVVMAVPQQCDNVADPGGESGGPTDPPAGGAPPAATAPLAEVDPCQLLTETTAPQVGIEDVASGEPGTTNAYRQCSWPVAGATDQSSYGVVVGVSDTLTLADISADFAGATPLTVGAHDALQVQSSAGDYCSVYLGVGETSLVVNDVAGGAEVDHCGLAAQVAQLVEPGLP